MQNTTQLSSILPQSFLNGYDGFKDRLFIKLVHQGSARLKHTYFRTMFDMALTYHAFISNSNGSLVSMRITDSVMNQFGIDPDRMHEDALISMQKLFPENISFIEEYITNERQDPTPTVVITSARFLCGSSVILYPGALQKASSLLNGDIYLIPSSTEEMFAVKDHGKNPKTLRYCREKLEGLNSLNRQFDPDHLLSDTILHYDAQMQILQPAVEFKA